jgi:translation initiation factor IF-1
VAKDDLIELQGTVVEVLAGGNYRIKISDNHEVLARLNGKMRQFRIRVIAGDRVTVGVSPYDLKRGLITYRAK